MTLLPPPGSAPLIRADFSDDSAWEDLCVAATAEIYESPTDEYPFQANLNCINEAGYDGLTATDVQEMVRTMAQADLYDHGPSVIFVADSETFGQPDRPIAVYGMRSDEGKTFRVVPSAMWAVENNLSIANVDFDDFVDGCGDDGIYRAG